jgi:hypothetical protein
VARFVGLSAIVLALAVGYACGSSLPTPRTRTPPEGSIDYIEVPYPPPAARVEVIPPKPAEGAVWVDGEWSWQGRRWTWETGGWVKPPPQAYFAPWRTKRLDNGKLLFASGSWRSETDRPIPKPVILAPAQSSLGEEGSPAPAASSASP